MLPSPNSCIACDRPFPANGELVSLPQGRRIAFDPALGRVWRICTKCGEWNLLGAEAAGEAVPELARRFDASASAGTPGIAVAKVSDRMELLRIGTRTELVAGAMALSDRRRALHRIGTVPAVFVLGLIGLLLSLLVVGGWSPTWGFAAQFIAWFGSVSLVRWFRRRRRGLRATTQRLVVAVLALAGGTYFPWTGVDPSTISGIGFRVGMAFVFAGWVTYGVGYLARQRLPSGRKLFIDAESVESMVLDLTRGEHAMLIAPFGDMPLDRTDSEHVLTNLAEWRGGVPSDTLDRAHALVATTEHLSGVVEMVANASQGHGGRIRLGDLPYVYWVALDLALTRERDRPTRLAGAEEVDAVAAIAESLDRGE